MDIIDIIQYNCIRTQIVTDAMELLRDGYPLDTRTKRALGSLGVDYNEFIRRFEIKTDTRVQ